MSSPGLPANDFKAYAFYGTVGMFLEIDRYSDKRAKVATYDESGARFQRNVRDRSFQGSGVPKGLKEMAIRLSKAAPVPFLRLDFHHGHNGIFLGEITPHPGGIYAGSIFDEVDRKLGKYYEDAKARLYVDLLRGKQFPEFQKAYGQVI